MTEFIKTFALVALILMLIMLIPWLIYQLFDLRRLNKQADEAWRMFQEAHKKIMELDKDE